ncbi:MAG: hypothetical protein LBS09_04260 [Bacteroidales bacterium]|jgi:hypothetical protein|nr:hypothetical protein [Bacteroidales bacterium]
MRSALEAGAFTYVQVMRFSLSALSIEGRGLGLYCSTADGEGWEPLGVFQPSKTGKGTKIYPRWTGLPVSESISA